MRSVLVAMTWEYLQRSRWYLLLGLVGANLLPVLLLTALRLEGAVDPLEPGFVTMQVVMVQLHIFTFGAMLLTAHEITPRLYTMPIDSMTLAAGRMFPAMILMGLQELASTAALNVAFGLNWPLWGPALLGSVTIAMILASLWISEKSALQPLCVCVAAVIIGLWFKSRCGPVFSLPTRIWSEVTPADAATLLVLGAISYGVAVVGVARSRCGETLGSGRLSGWFLQILEQLLEFRRSGQTRFQSAAQAQFWFEWHRKGWVLPVVLLCSLFMGCAMWLFFNRDPRGLLEGLAASGALLSIAGMIAGMAVGSVGASESNLEMGQFLATRPVADRDLARTLLQVMARTVCLSWVIWVAAFGILFGLVLAAGAVPRPSPLQGLRWWYFPGALVACWTVAGVTGSLSMTGRALLLAKSVTGLFAFVVGVELLLKLFDPATRVWMHAALMGLTGVAFGVITVWVIAVARRRSLVGWPFVAIAAWVWAGLVAITTFETLRTPDAPAGMAVFLAGVAALSVAPFALAPLAIRWNRHR